jgi:hypothetical protein
VGRKCDTNPRGGEVTTRAENPTRDSEMVSQQAMSPVICVRTQAMIPGKPGERGPAATRVAFRQVAGLLVFSEKGSYV